jgi:aryl-alcohol dehydrogenase-like predicted oxidoreductase
MLAAKKRGVTFLDDARYDDETGSAPLATGYSEVVFGELFRAAGGGAIRRSLRTSSGGSSGPSSRRPRSCVVLREYVESAEAVEALERSGAAVVASFALFGGVLTGKYDDPAAPGRMRDELDDPDLAPSRRAVPTLRALAAELDTTPAALAIAFALANRRVSSVLFGATIPEPVTENVAAAELVARSTDARLDRIRALSRANGA